MIEQMENLSDENREELIRVLSTQMLAPGTPNTERRVIGLRIRELIQGRSAEMVRRIELERGLAPKAA